jgi:hypothetical protein
MNRLTIVASMVALAAATVGCGNSPGQANSLVDVGPSSVSASSEGGAGNLTTLAKGGNRGGGGTGGGGTTSGVGSLSLKMVIDANGDGLPNWNDHVTFTLSTSATSPFVRVDCYQGSTWVYVASVGYFDAYLWPKEFTLSSTSWSSGAADCTATLYTSTDGSSTTTLATLPFHVNP